MNDFSRGVKRWFRAVGIVILVVVLLKLFIVDFIQVEGHSMVPTLSHQERLMVNKFIYLLKKPSPGEIIVFQSPQDKTHYLIKRVVAVEGDTIEISDGTIIVNGEVRSESYILNKTIGEFAKRLIPKNTVFVLGDNRNNSKDSRFEDVGFIPLKLVKGKIFLKVWPFKNSLK